MLGISTHDAVLVLTNVFRELARAGAVKAVSTDTAGTIYDVGGAYAPKMSATWWFSVQKAKNRCERTDPHW